MGLPVELFVTASVPVRVPVAVGTKSTETVQLAPAASVAVSEHVVAVCAKSPVSPSVFSDIATVLVFVMVKVCAGELAPMSVAGKVAEVAAMVAVVSRPVPVSVDVSVELPVLLSTIVSVPAAYQLPSARRRLRQCRYRRREPTLCRCSP